MRFSKAPLIATLMAVALSLLIILPALAENTDGEVTHGQGTTSELIVGVYDPNEIDGTATRAERPIPGPPGANGALPGRQDAVIDSPSVFPKDTFFNGKLYVSNRHDPLEDGNSVEGGYNTVLVTQVGPNEDDACLSVTVKNTRSGGGSIELTLVPSETADTKWLWMERT